jgi:hypothetical protein
MNYKSVILFYFLLLTFFYSCKKSGNGIIETFSPELVSSTPANRETDVSIYTKEIVLIFNENVTLKSEYEITLNGIALNEVIPGIQKDLKIILPFNLEPGTLYTLIIPPNTIKGPTGVFIPTEIK